MTTTREDPIYAMGHTEGERGRLVEQAALYEGSTRQLLSEAGLRAGARVLDAGCGVGDVTLLAAAVVGPDGLVVGVDRDPEALAVAEARASSAGYDHVRFVKGDLREVTFDEPFDAVVGRFVLMYLSDATEAVRSLARHIRPGGVVALQEFQFEGLFHSYPELPDSLYQRTVAWVVETFRRAGVDTNMGLGLPATLRDAGLPWPEAFVHVPLAGGADHPAYSLFGHVLESLLPLIEGLGVASADEIGVATYAERLSAEAMAHGAVGSAAPVVAAWSRVPDGIDAPA
jgi:SAM-dependent methyltransferase